MRERALVCGGEFTAGYLNGSGFQVKARLPYQAGAL
jgi:signal transduction histidine kinase